MQTYINKKSKNILNIFCKKVGMNSVFEKDRMLPVTILELENFTLLKSKINNNNVNLLLGFLMKKAKHFNKAYKVHLDKMVKQNNNFPSLLKESNISENCLKNIENDLKENNFENIVNKSISINFVNLPKGKGTMGPMKKHNCSGQSASHGNSRSHRKPTSMGAIGPARVFKGSVGAGRSRNNVFVGNIKITCCKKHNDKYYLIVKGSLPGSNSSIGSLQMNFA